MLEPFTEFSYSGNDADIALGKTIIQEGGVGCLMVAGGQGSRLSFNGPKGCFPITPLTQRSLFQLFAEKIVKAVKTYSRLLKLAIMTSPENHEETVLFFEKNERFGLKSSQLGFFKQETLPLLDDCGKEFFESPGLIAVAPDGNGGALQAFYQSGIFKQWVTDGIRYLNFIIVDNPLADPFDPELIGVMARCNSDVVIKSIQRENPLENVGIIVKKEDKVVVVEYSEISEEERTRRNPDHSLYHPCANISLFCFSMDFILKIATDPKCVMPIHKAYKAVKYMDTSGKTIQADKPMAWKFEKFIFDVLPMANRVDVLVYPREMCFAPLKNKLGQDSIKTVQEALKKRGEL